MQRKETRGRRIVEISLIWVLLIIFLVSSSVILLLLMLYYQKQMLVQNTQTYQTIIQKQELQLAQTEQKRQQELFQFRTQFEQSLKMDFAQLSEGIDRKLMIMQSQFDTKLNKNHEQSTETFQKIIERLVRIDQTQQKIDALSTNIVSLQDILNDKKARGAFGEIQLTNIFQTIFGKNESIYRTQYTLSNSTKVDLMLFAPEPMGKVGIDSKFPLENYQKMIEANGSELILAERQFKADMKKHIDDISTKYIIPNETAEYAILFLPAEAIFAYINAYQQSIVEYGYQKNVWITSPTTLMAMLTTLQVVLKNIERDKYAQIIRQELQVLGKEFVRYQERWLSLTKHIDQVSKDVKDVNVTAKKISNHFSKIEQVNFDSDETEAHITNL